MKNIKVYIGISNSGKSTEAHKEWEKDPLNTIIVSRDKVRNLLWNYTDENVHEYYKRTDFNKLEKEVTKYCDTLIYEALESNKTVILDNTHLNFERDIKSLEYWNVPIELVWFDITLKEALTRNMGRNRKVDENIIKKQYNNYIQLRKGFSSYSFSPAEFINDNTLEACYLLDLDGTVAHMTDRSPYDWKRVGEDYVDVSVKKVSNAIFATHTGKVFVCTGRDGSCLKESLKWLDNKGVYYDKIFIRKEGDVRPDWVVKEEMWRQISKDNYIAGLIDDRLQVCRRARALGLKVFQVEYGNF